jgi:peptidyl-prolyl cis-trans isomerase C
MRIPWCVMACFVFLASTVPIAHSEELAKVDDVVIKDSDFMHMVSLLPSYWRQPNKEKGIDKGKLLDKLINEILIAREARKLNLEERDDYKQRLESVKRELLVDVYLKKLYEGQNTEANQRKYQQENKDRFSTPEMARIALITVRTKEEAQEVLNKIKNGEDFAELAKTHSIGAAADNGGDMGFLSKRGLSRLRAEVAFSMKKGEIKGPVEASGGYNIIKLLDRKDRELIPYENIRSKVANDYALKLRDDEIARLRKAAKIHVDKEALDKLAIR